MYTFQTNIDPTRHDDFVKKQPLANLLQSSSWAKVKNDWGHEIVGVLEQGELVASASILIKKLPLGFTMCYTPRGPVMDYDNEELVAFFMQHLRKFATTKRALFIKMDPAIAYHSFFFGEEQVLQEGVLKKIETLQSAGAKWQGLTTDMHETIQPRFQANVYAKDFSEENLNKKTKQLLRTARNKGIRIKIGQTELLDAFIPLMNLTEERKGVKLRSGDNGSYYKKLLETFPEDAFLLIATLPLTENLNTVKKRHLENEEQIKKLQEKLGDKYFQEEALSKNERNKKKSLEDIKASLVREEIELSEKITTHGEEVPVACALLICFGNTCEHLYAGMDESYKRYMPAYLAWFESIQECFRRGAKNCNLGGLEGSLDDGLLKFKNNFHPKIEEFIGEFDLPVNKILFHASEIAYKIRKKLR